MKPGSGGDRVLVDTNIFLEWLLDQQRADECRILLEKVQNGEMEALVTDFALHSIAIIIERSGKKADLPDLFTALASFEGLSVLHATLEEHVEVARLAQATGLDFDDAYQAYFARRMNVPVVSYDRHFDRVGQRREPVDFL